jgi:putative Mn2+ efflux pump MntP
MPRSVSYVFIVIGGLVAIYAQAKESQNQMILIGGIVLLMLGVYNISKHIPSKTDGDDEQQNNV